LTTAPNRRWLRFSLRTLFVVVFAAGCVLGCAVYYLDWVRQRREFLARDSVYVPVVDFVTVENWHSAPWPLRWFGAEAAHFPQFNLPADTSDEDLTRVQKLFPEVKVARLPSG
jgi:hypothetical protein